MFITAAFACTNFHLVGGDGKIDNGAVLDVLIAPTAFKGSLSPAAVAAAMASGLQGMARLTIAPLADGGDGTIEAVKLAKGGDICRIKASGPLNEPIEAGFLLLPGQAVVELASICGIALLDGRLNPLGAHTTGLGQVVRHCIELGCQSITVTVGGSASTDGGTGALAALGAKFYDCRGRPLAKGGGALLELDDCDLSGLIQSGYRLSLACDVINPLLGDNGAARVFAPQKGADANQVEILENGLLRLAAVLESKTGRKVASIPGAGAAGGTAFGLSCALGARIIKGFNWLADLIDLDRKIQNCDLVVTGEGKFDRQSLSGKAIGELAARCKMYNRPLWILAAAVDDEVQGFDSAVIAPLARGSERVDSQAIKLEMTRLWKLHMKP